MRRFLVENLNAHDGMCTIAGPEARHMTRVLRMEAGDRFVLMDGKGSRFLASIESATPQGVRVILERSLPKPPPSPVTIVLCQALLKSGPMDYLIQKTSELGVDHILPFSSLRTVTMLKRERLANRMRHWREIARSSAKQSGRVIPAQIDVPTSLRELIARWKEKKEMKAILWEGEGATDLKGLLRGSFRAGKFIGMVGPEGGFAGEEVELAEDAGFIPVTLGNRVLRSETAAMTMVAIVQYEWGDLGMT
jgi:16S rRNA (uracil1498-N3)-methyltransferase